MPPHWPLTSNDENALHHRHRCRVDRGLSERAVDALACLFEAPGLAAAATEYTQRARILYEWEGLASSPIEEAQYAEEYIAGNPDSPFVPYLYLFVAERWRYAFEYFVRSGNKPGIAASAEKYRDFIARARGADAFVRLVADDSDGMPFLAVNVGIHARDR